ncbi:uncharacterized protein LOC125500380 [Athalia rosae]|uniref:uncharacterized protein LOC125500380 n=1 Tax=Athalia rosae TaxID=37344 RepID=UPI00203362DD|nr:uncharacterized protein LOC125500380 [Athalia rosae]
MLSEFNRTLENQHVKFSDAKLKKDDIANVSSRHKKLIILRNLNKIKATKNQNYTPVEVVENHNDVTEQSSSSTNTINERLEIIRECGSNSMTESTDTSYFHDMEVREAFGPHFSESEINKNAPNSIGNVEIQTIDRKLSLSLEIRRWAVSNCINHNHLTELLQILHNHGHSDLPLSSRTFLGTQRQLTLTDMNPGQYYHFGLAHGLFQSLQRYYLPEKYPSEIKCDVNIDGPPISKSSGSQLWPILASICTDFYTEPFILGIYRGYEKPHDRNEISTKFRGRG